MTSVLRVVPLAIISDRAEKDLGCNFDSNVAAHSYPSGIKERVPMHC